MSQRNKSSASFKKHDSIDKKFGTTRRHDSNTFVSATTTIIGFLSLTIGHGRPGRISGGAIEADLVGLDGLEFLELSILVPCRNADLPFSGGGKVSVVSQISCNIE